MKKLVLNLLAGFVFSSSILLVGYHSSVFSNGSGPPVGRTGGLGEATCISGGCHAGTVLQSPTTLSVSFSTQNYTPGGPPVTVTVTNAGTAGGRFGFQVKSVTSANVQAGSMTAGTGQRVSSSGGRQYLGHSTPNTTGVWSFQWTPPATNVGDVLFFVASHNGPSQGRSTVSTGAVALSPSPVALPSPIASSSVRIFPNPATEHAVIGYALDKEADVTVQIMSLKGQMVSTYSLGNQSVGDQSFKLPLSGHIAAGQYVIRLVANGAVQSHKLVVL
jgi:flagellar hook assembly protein FlgD